MGDLILVALLQLAGAAVIIAELFLPSAGVLSIIAVGLIGYSIYIVFTAISETAGAVLIGIDMILLPVAVIVGIKLIARSPLTLKTSLSRAGGVISQSPELETYLDARGQAVSDLRPSGIAVINGRRLDVTTRGEYIERGADVYVSAVRGNQIIVRQTKPKIETP
jgi:membrane-bound ClpP family serine protease